MDNVNAPQAPMEQLDPQDVQQNKVMAILAYFGILVLIPIFAAPNSKFARYHANQGLILFLAYICCYVVMHIAVRMLYSVSTALTGLITLVVGIAYIVLLVFAIIGIINAAQGKCKPLPLIGNFTLLK